MWSSGVGVPNFEFAFNSEVFSNMVMQIEVVTGGDVGGGSLLIRDENKKGAWSPPHGFDVFSHLEFHAY